jgi:hypothetical protein
MEVPEVCFQVVPVTRPCQPIRRGGVLQAEEACLQDIKADVVEERCERLCSIPSYGSSYAGLRM